MSLLVLPARFTGRLEKSEGPSLEGGGKLGSTSEGEKRFDALPADLEVGRCGASGGRRKSNMLTRMGHCSLLLACWAISRRTLLPCSLIRGSALPLWTVGREAARC